MECDTIQKVVSNLRNPINAKERIHFTSRSILFLVKLFEGKRIDTIELHAILLRMAFASGCFREEKHFVNMKDIVVYLYSQLPLCITCEDITVIGDFFSVTCDSDYKEVEDMKIILSQLNR